MTALDERQKILLDWLAEHLGGTEGQLTPASADASFRRYFRYKSAAAPSLVIMDAPPQHESVGPFVVLARHLRELGLHVPQVHAHCEVRGFALLEDLGSTWLLSRLQAADGRRGATEWYTKVFSELMKMQANGHALAQQLPRYDEAIFLREMNLLPEWFLTHHLKMELTASDQQVLHHAFAAIIEQLLKQPTGLVHRDFHSRNIMVLDDNQLGIIDFQDAVCGPLTYDWVSVLKDCYVRWPKEWVRSWVSDFYRQWAQAGLVHGVSLDQWREDFEWMGLQRHLKVLGIFARLNYRDHKPQYINDLPLVMDYVVETLIELEALSPFWNWWQDRVLPQWRRVSR